VHAGSPPKKTQTTSDYHRWIAARCAIIGAKGASAVETAHSKRVRVFGNVANSTLSRTPAEVYSEATTALQNGTDFLCPGCGISPNTALENILQLKRARNNYFLRVLA